MNFLQIFDCFLPTSSSRTALWTSRNWVLSWLCIWFTLIVITDDCLAARSPTMSAPSFRSVGTYALKEVSFVQGAGGGFILHLIIREDELEQGASCDRSCRWWDLSHDHSCICRPPRWRLHSGCVLSHTRFLASCFFQEPNFSQQWRKIQGSSVMFHLGNDHYVPPHSPPDDAIENCNLYCSCPHFCFMVFGVFWASQTPPLTPFLQDEKIKVSLGPSPWFWAQD